jgi:hypothetical protein
MNKFKRLVQVAVNAYWEYKPLWTPRRLTTSLDEIEIDRPIFVLGVQGGGLTLLTRMIHRNKDVVTIGGGRAYWVGNNEMDKQYVRELPEDFTLRSPKFQSPTFKAHMKGDEYEHPIFGTERNWVYACDDLLDQYRKTEDDWTANKEARFKNAIKESVRAYAPDPTDARFVDMSQTFSLKVPLLRKMFPEARLVIQLRNPYATCIKEAQDHSYDWRRTVGMERKLRIFSTHWRNTYTYAIEDTEDLEHRIIVRYEDLVRDPEEVLRQVLETIGIDYKPDMIPRAHHKLPLGSSEHHKWHPIRTGANEKYLDELDGGTASVIQNTVDDVAQKFGYQSPV